ncbi:hypothetical protein ACTXT7_014709 [Hymenolepis weldensis]
MDNEAMSSDMWILSPRRHNTKTNDDYKGKDDNNDKINYYKDKPTKKKPITMMITTTARPITTKPVKTTNITKQTEPHRKTLEVANATAQYLIYCKTGDPPGECPKYRASCRTAEIFRRCPNICKNCVWSSEAAVCLGEYI